MATFNTYDYDFLCKCLGEGSAAFKAEAIKRLTNLVINDKKQFISNSRQVILSLQENLSDDKQDLNILSTLLLSEIIINVITKQNEQLIKSKLLKYVVQNLGHVSKTSLRKASHTCLLAFVKTYHNFDNLVAVYNEQGLNHASYLIKQKSINSFQSIFILQAKFFNWESNQSKIITEYLIDMLDDQNPYISKASAQCILCMCKVQGIKTLANSLNQKSLIKLRRFLDETVTKTPMSQTQITSKDITEILDSFKKKQGKPTISISPQVQQQAKTPLKTSLNQAHQRRLQKIRQSLANSKEQKKVPQQFFSGKMFGVFNNEGTLKERTQAAQQLLYKIQINKNKPEFDNSVKHIMPGIIKMLRDPNPKIVGVSLKILENIIQESKSADIQQSFNLVSVIVEKLGDQKISIRQMVSKVIKEMFKKTEKKIWIKQFLQNMRRNSNTFLKDQTLSLIHYMYQEYPAEEIEYDPIGLIQQIVPLTEDPKTKIKIRTLDCLSQIAFKTSVQNANQFLKGKMPQVFYQMYSEKVSKLIYQQQKRKQAQIQKNKKIKEEENSYKTAYNQRNALRKKIEKNDESPLNVSIDVIRRRVSNLKKPTRNVMSTQETNSLENTQRTIDRTIEDVELMLPSLYKKTKTNKFALKKTEFSPMKTLDNKNSDYLSKQDLKPLRQPQKEMKTIIGDLKNTDWKIQFETLNKLRRLCQFNPELMLAAPGTTIHMIVLDLLSLIESLRSSVSKNALICLNQFILVLNKQIDPEMQIILEKLMKKSADTNAFINSQVQKCLNTLSTHTTQSKIIQKIMIYKESKNFDVKQACLVTLLYMKDDERIRQKQYAKLTQSFAFFLSEAQQQLRSKARVGIIQICRNLGDWYRILRGKMNPLCFKSVCELMTKNSIQQPISNQKPRSRINSQLQTLSIQQNSKSLSQKPPSVFKQKPRTKAIKVTQFPPEFNNIGNYLDQCNSSDWKKRIEAINKVKDIALKNPAQFQQYRSNTHFLDLLSKQILQPNIKVSVNALQCFLQIIHVIKPIIQSSISVISNSIFNSLSSNKPQVKDYAEKAMQQLVLNIQITIFLQQMCHGILYSLPKSRIYLVIKLTQMLEGIHQTRKQLLFKHVFPTLNKLMDEYRAQLMPYVVNLFVKLYDIMGNNMFSHLTKFKEVRQLIAK